MSFNNSYQSSYSNANLKSQSQSQLWMGGLDLSWDESFLKSLWISLGFPQVNIKFIKDQKNPQNVNAGYCFIEFPNIESASQALTQNGIQIPNSNRFIQLNWANGPQQQQFQQNQSQGFNNQDGSRLNEFSIFIGDLAPDVSDSILFEFFATKYSSVSGTKIMVDKMSGQSKGYGFVRFLEESEQQRSLVEMQGSLLNGRPIRVSTATPRNKLQQPQHQHQQQHQFQRQQFSQNQNLGGQFAPPPQQQQPQQQQQQQQISNPLDSQSQPPLNQFTDPNNTTVFVGGLSSIVNEDQLRLFFQPFGDITYVKIPVGKGCGFVQYVTRQSAELAILKMQGYPIANSRIRLSWGRSNSTPDGQSSQYKPQQELPTLYGYPSPNVQDPNQLQPSQLQQQQHHLATLNQYSSVNPVNGSYGVEQIAQQAQFNPEQSENVDQSRLNQLYLAARDGRLDVLDSASNGYIFN